MEEAINLRLIVVFLFVIMTSVQESESVDSSNFKRCDQSAFCKRQREYKPESSPYVADFESFRRSDANVAIDILNTDNQKPFLFELYTLEDGIFRMRINEVNPLKPRYEVPDIIQEVNSQNFQYTTDQSTRTITVTLKDQPRFKAVITCNPFRLDILDEMEPVFSINSRNMLNIEHLREKPAPIEDPEPPAEEEKEPQEGEETENEEEKEEATPEEEEDKKEDEDVDNKPGMWEESFKSFKDSKPRGPESIGLDTSFVNFAHVYGIPEHADSLALRSTVDSEPYRLYNLDVFEYELESRAALYGSIPFMIGHNAKRTVGLLWLNAAETWVDIDSSEDNKGVLGSLFSYFNSQDTVPEVNVHWMSESGVIDCYFMLGTSPKDVMRQYTKLTGTSYMPPKWSIAYHQCRWNYKDEDDVEQVDAGFDEHDIPYDCLWLDIEHTDGKRYFTWDNLKFPEPAKMQDNIAAKGRKMVTIIDPHIKVDNNYHIYKEAQAKNYFIKNNDGTEFKGWCWPGDSAYLDFTLPEVREWWASQFTPDIYKGSTSNLFTWNDMNEPSVFNGPELTMHKDIVHGGGWEHRHIHNLYGLLLQISTNKGLTVRSNDKERPFVLSRAFFAGTQKYGAIWTGDNTADWGHLRYSVPMVLSIGLCGIAHAGADVGGFFKNPEPELLARWYQVGAYQPFFRAHAHIDTSRREPWLFDDKITKTIRAAIRERYELMPFWYTLFYQSHITGEPPMRPLWYEFPTESEFFAEDTAFMVGSALMVQPVHRPDVQSTVVKLPGKNGWYDVYSHQYYPSPNTIALSTPLEKIAVLQQGGSILPRKMRVRRCSALMNNDPYTLFVALNPQGNAEGEIFIDDGHTFNYQKNEFNYRKLHFQNKVLSSSNLTSNASYITKSWLEKVVILGIEKPTQITVEYDGEKKSLEFSYVPQTRTLTIRKPMINMAEDWKIILN